MQYVTDAFSRLEGVGYGKFREINPKKTIELLQQKLVPTNAQESHGKTVVIPKRFEEGSQEIYIILGGRNCITGQDIPKFSNKIRTTLQIETTKKNGTNIEKSSREKRPMCLHPKCRAKGIRHYIVTECDEATPEEARKLLE